jgi:hypothetical protein
MQGMNWVRKWSFCIAALAGGIWMLLFWTKTKAVTDFLARLHPVLLIALFLPIYFFGSIVVTELLRTTIPTVERWSQKHYPMVVGICWILFSTVGLTMLFIARSMSERPVP